MEATKRTRIIGIGGAILGVGVVVTFLLRSAPAPVSLQDDEIPLPFGGGSVSSPVAGSILEIGAKNGVLVKKVTFPTGTDSESLQQDEMYLVVIPDDAAVTTVAFDDALALGGVHAVNYFGYRYTTPTAADEKANKTATALTQRFPGQFFASAKARAEDQSHGGTIAAFEAANSITMDVTNTLLGATLQKNSLYFLIVNEATPATLTIRSAVNNAVCGNGAIQSPETCDDGNTANSDGCSNACVVETDYRCTGEPSVCVSYLDYVKSLADTNHDDAISDNEALILTLDVADAPDQPYNTVSQFDMDVDGDVDNSDVAAILSALDLLTADPVCGDGVRQNGETCDDGNTTASDGCSATCTLESGYTCNTARPNVCTHIPVCGDGLREGSETCDDGNTTASDGCSATCTVESGYSCTTATPNVCTPDPVCGNGLREGSETCDDGNTANSDGCSSVCAVESGYSCTTATPNVCTHIPVCGDGIREGSETCDDGNTTASDGCSATCTVESGYSCTTATPNVCTPDPVCGNGLREGSETCDDGNTTASDGCSDVCAVETDFRCTGEPSVCVSYLNYVKSLADTNHDGTVSDNEALILTLAIADAPDQPYNTVSQYDMEPDGDVDNTDIATILAQLDILAPAQ